MDFFVLQRFTGSLEASEHGASDAEEDFALEEALGNREVAGVGAGDLPPIAGTEIMRVPAG